MHNQLEEVRAILRVDAIKDARARQRAEDFASRIVRDRYRNSFVVRYLVALVANGSSVDSGETTEPLRII